MLAAAVLWGLIGPVARFALAEGVQPLEIAFWRALIAGGLYAAHARMRGARPVARRDLPAIAGFGLVGVAFFYTAYLMAVETGGAALASVLLYSAPGWVALGAWLWFGERLDARTLAALFLAALGITLVAFLGGHGASEVRVSTAAIGWGLASGLAYATYYLVGKRYFGVYGTETVLAYALPIGAIALLPFVTFSARGTVAWVVILFLAVLPTYVAYLLYGAGLLRVPATRAATVAVLEPVVAAAAAFLLWGELLGIWGYAGAALVIAAVLFIATSRPRARPPA